MSSLEETLQLTERLRREAEALRVKYSALMTSSEALSLMTSVSVQQLREDNRDAVEQRLDDFSHRVREAIKQLALERGIEHMMEFLPVYADKALPVAAGGSAVPSFNPTIVEPPAADVATSSSRTRKRRRHLRPAKQPASPIVNRMFSSSSASVSHSGDDRQPAPQQFTAPTRTRVDVQVDAEGSSPSASGSRSFSPAEHRTSTDIRRGSATPSPQSFHASHHRIVTPNHDDDEQELKDLLEEAAGLLERKEQYHATSSLVPSVVVSAPDPRPSGYSIGGGDGVSDAARHDGVSNDADLSKMQAADLEGDGVISDDRGDDTIYATAAGNAEHLETGDHPETSEQFVPEEDWDAVIEAADNAAEQHDDHKATGAEAIADIPQSNSPRASRCSCTTPQGTRVVTARSAPRSAIDDHRASLRGARSILVSKDRPLVALAQYIHTVVPNRVAYEQTKRRCGEAHHSPMPKTISWSARK